MYRNDVGGGGGFFHIEILFFERKWTQNECKMNNTKGNKIWFRYVYGIDMNSYAKKTSVNSSLCVRKNIFEIFDISRFNRLSFVQLGLVLVA